MSFENNWRTELTAEDYFSHQQKRLQVSDRRPVLKSPADLVGPGIAAQAIRLSDFNDLLAMFNGYYCAPSGSANAPTPTGHYVGFVVADPELGGLQVFTNLATGTEYRRVFTRLPTDTDLVTWGAWA
jgi:hypothetical protein